MSRSPAISHGYTPSWQELGKWIPELREYMNEFLAWCDDWLKHSRRDSKVRFMRTQLRGLKQNFSLLVQANNAGDFEKATALYYAFYEALYGLWFVRSHKSPASIEPAADTRS